MTQSRTPDADYWHRKSPERQIRATVAQVFAQESLKNERKVAWVRMVASLISSTLDVLVFLFPKNLLGETAIAPTIALISVSGLVISSGILYALLRPDAWRSLPKLQIAIPIFDGLLIAVVTTNLWHVLGEVKPEIITNIAALCCLVAVSGGIRIHRQASILTTLLALADFVYAAFLFQLDAAVSLFVLFSIFSTGMVGMLTAGIVRRQGKNEAGRLLMQQFLPKTVVDAAFDRPLHLLEEARECDVTIMVTDLRGFTNYAEKLDPRTVMDFLNQLQGFLARTVENRGGWVDKFMGDGMLAVFGSPLGLDNHAEQAVLAAQDILREVSRWSPLPIGIGLHSGSVVTGCLGSDSHLEFTVIGDTVNVAARLEALTKDAGCPLLLSKATQARLTLRSLISIGRMPIRGRNEHIEVFTIPKVLR